LGPELHNQIFNGKQVFQFPAPLLEIAGVRAFPCSLFQAPGFPKKSFSWHCCG
jgi:hypothetical protein